VSRPVVGVCAAVERAAWAAWRDTEIALIQRTYVKALQAAGALVLVLPPDDAVAEAPGELLEGIDALVLAGGSDVDPASYGASPHPETAGARSDRDRFELALARGALERDMPVLGICRGMHVLNVARGGTLVQHLPEATGHEDHRRVPGTFDDHRVVLVPGSLAARAVGAESTAVRSHHHQGVDELGEGLVVTGRAEGDDVIEAIEDPEVGFALGVLWHPEEDPESRVIGALVARAGAREVAR
jgi:putative glutamine amidotransferase